MVGRDVEQTRDGRASFIDALRSNLPSALGVAVWVVCFWAVRSDWILTTNFLITTVMLGLFAAAILVSAFRRFCVAASVGSATAAALWPFVSNGIVYRGGAWLLVALVVTAMVWIGLAVRSLKPFELCPPHRRRSIGQLLLSGSVLCKSVLFRGRSVALGIAGVLVATAVGGWTGSTLYASLFGPTHPESTRTIVDNGLVDWVWVGNVSTTTAEIKARIYGDEPSASDVAAEVFPVGQPGRTLIVPAVVLSNRVAIFELEGLRPNTVYTYQIVTSSDDATPKSGPRGEFSTFPAGASSFTLAFGSCARSGSNGAVFETIAAQDPLLYVMAGDLHYQNIGVNDQDVFDDAYGRTLTQPAQAQLYRSTPVAYMWDDHDFGQNNSDGHSASRDAAFASYAANVPAYPTVEVANDNEPSIYQSYTVGQVRVIMTDARAHRHLDSMPGMSQQSMLGTQQREWLKQELLTASESHSLVIWVNPVPWIATVDDGEFATANSVKAGTAADSWGGYPEERADIANHIVDNAINNLIMVSGDSHMVTIDDGSNSNFSDKPGPGFPVLHVAALDRVGSLKGGPYSHGQHLGGGQFGLIDVEDDESSVHVTLTGMDWEGKVLVEHSVTFEE